jgi:hypothetical protein
MLCCERFHRLPEEAADGFSFLFAELVRTMRTVLLAFSLLGIFCLKGLAQIRPEEVQVRCADAIRTDWHPQWIYASSETEVWAGGIGCVLHSTDNGETWQRDSVGEPCHLYENMMQDGVGRFLLMRGDGVLLRKEATGWRELPGTLSSRAIAAAGDCIVAAGSSVLDVDGGLHFWTRLGDSLWQHQGSIPGTKDILNMAVDPKTGDVWAGGTQYHSFNFLLKLPRGGGLVSLTEPGSRSSRGDAPNGFAFLRDTVLVSYPGGIGFYTQSGRKVGLLPMDSLYDGEQTYVAWMRQFSSGIYLCIADLNALKYSIYRYSVGRKLGEAIFQNSLIANYSKTSLSPEGGFLYRLPISRVESCRQAAHGPPMPMPALDSALNHPPLMKGRCDRGWIAHEAGCLGLVGENLKMFDTLCATPTGVYVDDCSSSAEGEIIAASCDGGATALLSRDRGSHWDTLVYFAVCKVLATGKGEVCLIDSSGYHVWNRAGTLIADGSSSFKQYAYLTGMNNDELVVLDSTKIHYLRKGKWKSFAPKGVSTDTLEFLWADPTKGYFFFTNMLEYRLHYSLDGGKTWETFTAGGPISGMTMTRRGETLLLSEMQVQFNPNLREKASWTTLDGHLAEWTESPDIWMDDDDQTLWILDRSNLYRYELRSP